uniref:Cystatin domain-containing protein n=1 Tax=Strongyloides papillosus TaxID=174720 RepID=A0A0N5B732_STREA
MNHLNVFIFIIAIFSIITEEFPHFHKHHKPQGWKSKNIKDKKIIQFGKEAVGQFNKDFYSNLKFAKVLEAKKKNTETDKHYSLKILAERDCGENSIDCSQEIGAEIYKKIENPKKLSIYAYKN